MSASADEKPLLEVADLHVSYGAQEAVRGISLSLPGGRVGALVGPNGAGKSSVLTAVAGLPIPGRRVRGRISLDGKRLDGASSERAAALGAALVPEGRRPFAELTVRENLLLGTYRRGRDEAAGEVERLERRFPILARRRETPAGRLSGGEQQLLAVARALAAAPRLLLMDEPSLGLAPIAVDEVFSLIRELRDEGVTILLAEALAQRALEVADRAWLLEEGRVRADGTGAELLRNPAVRAAALGA